MGAQYSLSACFSPELPNLHFASDLLHALFAAAGIHGDVVDRIELALSEGLTNAMKCTSQGLVELGMRREDDLLVISIRDGGEGFDIDNIPQPNLEEHHVGGYGIFIMREIMDSVSYERDGKWNVLTLTKRISGAD
ncbi:ATP-binding protein [Desulfovibrio subterraneus]|uniref:RsbW protein n=1 Tax=Desulfovibrio subterraneus TaxID=2718620 RepID=A0A7J0BLP3_9BACT|nr:ATP-binding protein [Desulfovibrio subterraneus]GFM34478.1 RsbW protein [Desulfovibrio subterraneus]